MASLLENQAVVANAGSDKGVHIKITI